jgi:hypothetical protein
MAIIHVVKPFIFQHDPKQTGSYIDKETKETVPVFALEGERQLFQIGVQEVPDFIAEHWYVKAHLKDFVAPPPQNTQPDYAFQMRALQAAKAGRNTTSIEAAAQPPPPLPPGVVTQERHYFAGQKIEDSPAPDMPQWMKGSS